MKHHQTHCWLHYVTHVPCLATPAWEWKPTLATVAVQYVLVYPHPRTPTHTHAHAHMHTCTPTHPHPPTPTHPHPPTSTPTPTPTYTPSHTLHLILILYRAYSSIQQPLHCRELTDCCCRYDRASGNTLSIQSMKRLVMHNSVKDRIYPFTFH